MKRIALLALLLVPACEDPSLGVGATVSNNGVSVSPVYTGRAGELTVSVSP